MSVQIRVRVLDCCSEAEDIVSMFTSCSNISLFIGYWVSNMCYLVQHVQMSSHNDGYLNHVIVFYIT